MATVLQHRRHVDAGRFIVRTWRVVQLSLAIVVDEADESEHWLAVLIKSGLASGNELEWLLRESQELRAIFSKSLTTARQNHQILKS